MERLFQLLGLAPSEDEKAFLDKLGEDAPQSMRVVGRGTLVMDARDARQSEGARRMAEDARRLVR